jgi:DNA (cytosine-5)-methyltransferase 1
MCHPDEIRVLSLKECALIQEFPNDWEFAGTVQQRYEQVGNAVPTRLGFVAGQTIANALDLACGGDERRQFLSRAAAAFAPPLRRVYLSSHVRTRSWYRGGEVFIWDDDADQQEAEYKPGRR